MFLVLKHGKSSIKCDLWNCNWYYGFIVNTLGTRLASAEQILLVMYRTDMVIYGHSESDIFVSGQSQYPLSNLKVRNRS